MGYNDYYIYKNARRLLKLSTVKYSLDIYVNKWYKKPLYWFKKIFGLYKKYDK